MTATTTPLRRDKRTDGQGQVTAPPYDRDLEYVLAHVALLHPEKVGLLLDRGMTAATIYQPSPQAIVRAVLAAHVDGKQLDQYTIQDRLGPTFDQRELVEVIATEVVPDDRRITDWVARARDLEAKRRLLAAVEEAKQAIREGLPIGAAVDRLRDVGELAAPSDVDDDPDLDDFLAADEEPFDWLIPGLIERGDRIVVTGNEGTGKSTLVRQIGTQAASGVHPFTHKPIEPLSVLVVDCENSERQARRALQPLRDAAGDRYRPGQLRLRILGHALDIAQPDVAADLAARIERHAVDLLVIGPLYKLIDDDPIKEVPARQVADVLDRLRQIRGTALLIEAHSPYAEGAKAKRPQRPYGASLWSRWPEFGMYLAPDGQLQHWRGQREQRDWPRKLARATPWPWSIDATVPQEEEWHGPTRCIEALVETLAEMPGEELSTNQLGKAMRERGRSFRNEIVSAAATQAADEGRINRRPGPRASLLYSHRGDDQQTIPEAF